MKCKNRPIFFVLLLIIIPQLLLAQKKIENFKVVAPTYVIGTQNLDIEIQIVDEDNELDAYFEGHGLFTIDSKDTLLSFKAGKAVIQKSTPTNNRTFSIAYLDKEEKVHVRFIAAWLSLLPPLLAIIFALIFREVIVSIFIGIFCGAFILQGFSLWNLIPAMLAVLDKYILQALYSTDHLSVILFTTVIGGLVAVVSKNGGMGGIVNILARFANSVRNTKLVTWLLGILIFFDDYANTLIVGNTMRPVTDRFRISREKLAYIVDSTSAPVAAIAFVTTWIGAELGYIKDATSEINAKLGAGDIEPIKEGAYSIFLNSLEYAFYPLFAIIFMLFLIYMKRDFGPMYKAEKRARETGELNKMSSKNKQTEEEEGGDAFQKLEPAHHVKKRWYNAFFPIILVIVITFGGLIYTGMQGASAKLVSAGASVEQQAQVWQNLNLVNDGIEPTFIRKIGILLGNSDAYITLLWSSLLGLILAIILTVSQRIMSLQKSMETMVLGFKTVLPAILILIFAWALAGVNEDLHTADFLSNLLGKGTSPYILPALTFVLAGFIAFATGSSWGTMAILYPLILQATWETCVQAGLDYDTTMTIFYHVTAVVLAGSVFGDHCSPISDTTILSSLASGCNHIEHVRTQLPYALVVGTVSLLASSVFFYLGLPWYLNYLLGIVLLFAVVRWLGKKI